MSHNRFKLFQNTIPLDYTTEPFVPFIAERDGLGYIVGVDRKRLTKNKPETQGTTRAKSPRKTVFLKEIYTQGQTQWNKLTNVKSLNSQIKLRIDSEIEIPQVEIPLLLFNKRKQFNELHKEALSSRKSSTMNTHSPRLGRTTRRDSMTPPLGYYDSQPRIKTPGFIFKTSQSVKSPKQITVKCETPRAQSPLKQTSLISTIVLERAYEKERILTEQRTQFAPRHFHISVLENAHLKVAAMRMKIREMRARERKPIQHM